MSVIGRKVFITKDDGGGDEANAGREFSSDFGGALA